MTAAKPNRRKVLGPSFSVDGATAPSAAPAAPAEPPPTDQPPVPSPDPAPDPEEQPPPTAPPAPAAASAAIARVETSTPDLLASMLASNGTGPREEAPRAGNGGGGINIPATALMSRPPDPAKDFVPNATRFLRFVKEAVRMQARLTGESEQDIVAAALTGERPIAPQLLDEAYRTLYHHERPRLFAAGGDQ